MNKSFCKIIWSRCYVQWIILLSFHINYLQTKLCLSWREWIQTQHGTRDHDHNCSDYFFKSKQYCSNTNIATHVNCSTTAFILFVYFNTSWFTLPHPVLYDIWFIRVYKHDKYELSFQWWWYIFKVMISWIKSKL